MRTSSLTALTLGALVALAGNASALDGPKPQARAPIVGFNSASDALRMGARDYFAGDKVGAVRALEYAATQGHALALWKLGRMYADGDGVPHDDLKAFEYFSKIADERADEMPDSAEAGLVASAFVALGNYFLTGIDKTYVKPNPGRAHEMFYYAASYFGDSGAQYSLARLYLEGTGVQKDARTAARWFNLAAEKGHTASQALLGRMLVAGEGVPRQRALGLMWLTLARDASDPLKEPWIVALYDKAVSSASESERQAALAYLEQYLRQRR